MSYQNTSLLASLPPALSKNSNSKIFKKVTLGDSFNPRSSFHNFVEHQPNSPHIAASEKPNVSVSNYATSNSKNASVNLNRWQQTSAIFAHTTVSPDSTESATPRHNTQSLTEVNSLNRLYPAVESNQQSINNNLNQPHSANQAYQHIKPEFCNFVSQYGGYIPFSDSRMQSGQPYPQYIDQNHGYTCSGYGTSPNMNSYNQYNLNYGYKSPHPGIYHYTHNQFYNQPPNAYPPYSSFTDGSSAHNNQVSPTDSAISNESYFDAKDHYVFAFFRNFRGKELQLANPALPMRSIARILDEEWSIMDIHQKQYYQTLFEKSTGTNVLKRSSVDSSTDSQGSSAKRPPNPYLLYNREIRPQVQIDYPHLSVGEISKIISAQWKNLTQEEKMKYEVESKRLKREWLLQNKDDAQSAISSSINTDGSVEEEWEGKKPPKRRRKRVNAKDPNQPKHPMSAFLFYLSEVRPSYTAKYPGWTVGPISKMISQAWKELSDQDREKYVKKAYDDKVRYAREMEVFLSRRE